jgi:hypothetical protein
MQLNGPGQRTSANDEQDNADKEICKFFHYGLSVKCVSLRSQWPA